MRERDLETRLTQKGQVTIPVEIREKLGLKPKDKVRFEVEGEAVRLKRAVSRIDRHFGAVRASGNPLDWRQEREAFEQGVGEEVASEGQS